jgi:hypothetical protein
LDKTLERTNTNFERFGGIIFIHNDAFIAEYDKPRQNQWREMTLATYDKFLARYVAHRLILILLCLKDTIVELKDRI